MPALYLNYLMHELRFMYRKTVLVKWYGRTKAIVRFKPRCYIAVL